AGETIKLLKEHGDKPFFIAAGFFRPHCPYIAPRKFFDLYPPDKITLPYNPPNDRDDIPGLALRVYKKDMGMTQQQQREIIRAYYASISFMDEQVGKVMRSLEELGLKDNTIVIFMSDHGYSLGEHGMWQKRNLFEESTNTPVIISVPGMKGASERTTRIIEFTDIYPTIADIAGLEAPSYLQGKSFKALLDDPEAEFGGLANTAVQRRSERGRGWKFRGRSLRTSRWRYTEWDKGEKGVELYDKVNDPGEFDNLAKYESHRDTIRHLSKTLQQRIKKRSVFKGNE
ncbi:sulfatase-like hydrolase/transferase, partial [Sinomicrobium weinanense]